jgi:hypothetical protein
MGENRRSRIDSRSPDRSAGGPSRLPEGVPALRVADFGSRKEGCENDKGGALAP